MAAEEGRIARRAGIVAAGTLASRILGLVRDAVITASFEAGAAGTFFIAFTIPNSLRVLLGEGAVSAAVVPTYARVRERDGQGAASVFFSRMTTALALVLSITAALGAALAPVLVWVYATGYGRDRSAETAALTSWLFPYLALVGIAASVTGALQAERRFVAAAFAPLALNVSLIAAPFVFGGAALALGLPPVGALVVGVLVGGALHLAGLLPSARAAGLSLKPRAFHRDRDVRDAFKLLVPLIATLGVYQLNIAMTRSFSSLIHDEAVTQLYLIQRLVEMPQGMFALAIASASLPSISKAAAEGDGPEALRLYRESVAMALFVALPSTAALVALAEPTVAVLFGRGAFDMEQVRATAHALPIQALGIPAVALVRTAIPLFHALRDTRSPVVASAVNLVVFVGIAWVGHQTLGVAGLALATTSASALQALALAFLLRRRAGPLGFGALAPRAGKMLAASAIAFVAMFGLDALVPDTTCQALRAARFVGCASAGGVTYLGGLVAMGAPEAAAILQRFRR